MPNLDSKSEEVSEEAVSKTEERLNALDFGTPTDLSNELDDSTSDDEKKEDDVASDDQTDDSETKDDSTSDEKDDSDEKGSKDKEDPPEANDKVEIPDGHIRAAKRQGWTDEDIAEEIKANPDRALRLFQNAYETTNKVTRDFAAIGRDRAEATRKAVEEKAKVEAPKAKDYITTDEITKIADGDEAVMAALKSFNTALKERDTELIELRKAGPSTEDLDFAKSNQAADTARARATANEADIRRINEFFGAENMKSYNNFYGVIDKGQSMDDITPNQKNHRVEVLQIADQLIVGRAAQGIVTPVVEALEDAHLLVTESMREEIITDGIRSSLKKRSKGRTLRPSDSKKTPTDTGLRPAKDRKEAIANAEQRLSKLNFRS